MARGLQESQQNPEITVNELIMGLVTIDVSGGVDYGITDDEFNHAQFVFSGALTDNINVIVPDDTKIYYVFNNTTGAFTLTVKTSAGSGIAVAQGNRAVLGCDGTNVVQYA